jgi:hypothetical protein
MRRAIERYGKAWARVAAKTLADKGALKDASLILK